jgi:hypothetical protein
MLTKKQKTKKMDILLATGGLLLLGQFAYSKEETAPIHSNAKIAIKQGGTNKEELELSKDTLPRKREDLFYDTAIDLNVFPGTERLKTVFRREILKQKQEVERDNSKPLIQNVRQTSRMNERMPLYRIEVKKTDLLDKFGNLPPETFSTGMIPPGQISRSERLHEIKTLENRHAIAHRALLPKTRKMADAVPGRILGVDPQQQRKEGLNKAKAPSIVTLRRFQNNTRTTAQSQYIKPQVLPQLTDKSFRDRTITDFRTERPGGYFKEQMQREFSNLQKPRRTDIYLAARRPNITLTDRPKENAIHSLEDKEILRKTQDFLESKPLYYANANRNARPADQVKENAKDFRKNIKVNNINYVNATEKVILRPEDVIFTNREGQKFLPENRPPAVENAREKVATRTLDMSNTSRSGRRDI